MSKQPSAYTIFTLMTFRYVSCIPTTKPCLDLTKQPRCCHYMSNCIFYTTNLSQRHALHVISEFDSFIVISHSYMMINTKRSIIHPKITS